MKNDVVLNRILGQQVNNAGVGWAAFMVCNSNLRGHQRFTSLPSFNAW